MKELELAVGNEVPVDNDMGGTEVYVIARIERADQPREDGRRRLTVSPPYKITLVAKRDWLNAQRDIGIEAVQERLGV
jgi:hypothetical protein